jgi:hypothetical protein
VTVSEDKPAGKHRLISIHYFAPLILSAVPRSGHPVSVRH